MTSEGKRDWIIGISVGVVLLGFVFLGVSQMGTQMTRGTLTGVITAKDFEPAPETQISIGRSGVHQERVAGTYTFAVKVGAEGGKAYTVWVDEPTYKSRNVGDKFQFPRPTQ